MKYLESFYPPLFMRRKLAIILATEEKSEASYSGGSAEVYVMMQVEGQRNWGRGKR